MSKKTEKPSKPEVPNWPQIVVGVTHDDGRFVTYRAATRFYNGQYYWYDRVFLKNSQPSAEWLERHFGWLFQRGFNHGGIS